MTEGSSQVMTGLALVYFNLHYSFRLQVVVVCSSGKCKINGPRLIRTAFIQDPSTSREIGKVFQERSPSRELCCANAGAPYVIGSRVLPRESHHRCGAL